MRVYKHFGEVSLKIKCRTLKKEDQKSKTKVNKAQSSAIQGTINIKKRGRKPLVVKMAELESVQLPQNLLYLDEISSQYGFAPVELDARLAKISRLWDGTRTICLLCIQGESTFKMDSTRCKIKKNDAVLIDTGFLLQCDSISKDFKAVAILANKSFLFSPVFPRPIDLYYFIQQKAVLSLPEKLAARLFEMFDTMREKITHHKKADFFNQDIFNNHIVQQLAKSFCYELFNQYSKHIPLRRNSDSPATREMIILRFLHLLDQKVDSERMIGYYAENLGITPQYLTTILKAITGYSANQWVHIVACDKAKHLLAAQRKNPLIAAKELNYPDQASFSKMFKTETGFTPIQYQKTI